jgi:hypothetical protein
MIRYINLLIIISIINDIIRPTCHIIIFIVIIMITATDILLIIIIIKLLYLNTLTL